MERINCWKTKILGSRRSHGGLSRSRLGYRMVGLTKGCLTLSLIGLIGCTTLKKASIVGLAAGAGATVGTVLSGGCSCTDTGSHDECLCSLCGSVSYADRKRDYE